MSTPTILYVAHRSDYGDPALGTGFEHHNFFDTLHRMGLPILYFDIGELVRTHGRAGMNRRLAEVVKAETPDLMFTVLYKDEFDFDTVRSISESGDTVTFNWFCDDHWRFDNYSNQWAPCFHWVATTADSAVPKYAEMGYENLIRAQWAANPFTYRRPDPCPLEHDVTFVGRTYGERGKIIQMLRNEGFNVQQWGPGSLNGKLEQDQMIRVFATSRINLGLSGSGAPPATVAQFTKVHTGRMLRKLGLRRAASKAKRFITGPPKAHDPSAPSEFVEQIKGRDFEVPGAGGFHLTGRPQGLERYLADRTDVAQYDSPADLLDKVRYYLDHEDERAAIADAGYRRVHAEHTYVHRFVDVFKAVGLNTPEASHYLASPEGSPGSVTNIT
ncbi:MAG: glycosyltransferase [Planctomycetota bacterium]